MDVFLKEGISCILDVKAAYGEQGATNDISQRYQQVLKKMEDL